MSNTINIMPADLASKIAAGEVVGRPASVVKELVENSIDAGARSVTVVVADAGFSLIRVVDDASGMSSEDAAVVCERHATSKIRTYEDLEGIRSFGFRGEALASIAAVSHFELRTRMVTDDSGTLVRFEGGRRMLVEPCAAQPGTSVHVRNLFYNTPARRQFLKRPATEFRHIYETVQRFCISHPEIAFQLSSDEEIVLDVRQSTHADRLSDVLGKKTAEALLAFKDGTEPLVVSGFVGRPEFARKTRNEQFIFLNRRYIQSKSINHAVLQAYENLLEKGSFPVSLVFLEVDPHRVDVNVHPAKLEVKFSDEQSVYRTVVHAVRRALSSHNLIPSVSATGGAREFGVAPVEAWQELLRPAGGSLASSDVDISPYSFPGGVSGTTPQMEREGGDRPPPRDFATYQAVWQVHNKYVVVQTPDGLMIVDQHAAHERVLYEKVLARMSIRETESQQLLFPQTIELRAPEMKLILELQPFLERLGFNLKTFGKNTVVLDGVPADVRKGDERTILTDVLDLYRDDEQRVRLEPRERLAKSYACKAAIKAGDPLSVAGMRSLLQELSLTEIPFVCPHGRPVVINVSLSDLDRRFRRLG